MIDDNFSPDSIVEFEEKLQIIREMFTDEEVDSLCSFMQEYNPASKYRKPETLSEKCILLIFAFEQSKFAKTYSGLIGVKSKIGKVSVKDFFEFILYMKHYLKSYIKDDLKDCDENKTRVQLILDEITEEIKSNGDSYREYLEDNGMTDKDYVIMIDELSNQKYSLSAFIKPLKKYWKKIKNLIWVYSLSKVHPKLESNGEYIWTNVIDSVKELYKQFPFLCQRVETLSDSLFEMKVLGNALFQNNSKKDNILGVLFCDVFLYAFVYKENWQKNAFEECFDYFNETQKLGFIQFLNLSVEEGGSPYVEDFCDAMEHYCFDKNIEPAIKLDLVKRRNKLLIHDDGKYDTPQFVRVLNSKLKGVANKNPKDIDRLLYNDLDKLYGELIEQDYIEKDTDKDLFIYRLSGLNRPNGKELRQIVLGKAKRVGVRMGYILRCLCSDDKEQFRSSVLNNFFLSNKGKKPEFSTAMYQSWEDFRKNRSHVDPNFVEAVSLLEKIGFIHCEFSHKGK